MQNESELDASQLSRPPVITIDGPSGSGKGTMALRVSRLLNWHLLDSGALYRIVAHSVLNQAPQLLSAEGDQEKNNEQEVCALAAQLKIEFSPGKLVSQTLNILVNGVDVTDAIRSEAVGNAASLVARLPRVRAALLDQQRSARRGPGLVADGRDMGTAIFPDAPLKFFLTASPEARGLRRFNQLQAGGKNVSLRQVVDDIRARDERDTKRVASPLKPAGDAIVLDTTHMDANEVYARMREYIEPRFTTVFG